MKNFIEIRNASTHNLKGVSLKIPKNKIVGIIGPSGSGKSSLAVETLHAESQRKFLESQTAFIKQPSLLPDPPEVEEIEGLCPSICIGAGKMHRGSKSTVGSFSSILGILQKLYALLGRPHVNGKALTRHSPAQIFRLLKSQTLGSPAFPLKLELLAPLSKHKSAIQDVLAKCRRSGFAKVKVEAGVLDLEELNPSKINKDSPLFLVIDRWMLSENSIHKGSQQKRVQESLETAFEWGQGKLQIYNVANGRTQIYYNSYESQGYPDVLSRPTEASFSYYSPRGACPNCKGKGESCPVCKGSRFRPEIFQWKISDISLPELLAFPISKIPDWVAQLRQEFQASSVKELFSKRQMAIAAPLLEKLLSWTLDFKSLKLDYITLATPLSHLSTGEFQRCLYISHLRSRLSGLTYILDEPSQGFHPSEIPLISGIIRRLKEMGNHIIVVDHNLQIISQCEDIFEFGPGGGPLGGKLIFQGPGKKLPNSPLTGKYLKGQMGFSRSFLEKQIHRDLPLPQSNPRQKYISLQSIYTCAVMEAQLLCGAINIICGKTGSGKSRMLMNLKHQGKKLAGEMNWALMDSSPLRGRANSMVVSALSLFSPLRQLFASTTEAKIRGYKASHFSNHSKDGACPGCQGHGILKSSVEGLGEIKSGCEDCNGTRFKPEVLDVRLKGKTLWEILSLTVEEALSFYGHFPRIQRQLKILSVLGLGYLRLNQNTESLSGGENQRIKLALQLGNPRLEPSVFLLDTPSHGLHFEDLKKLSIALLSLAKLGHCVVLADNHPDLVKMSDWVIELEEQTGKPPNIKYSLSPSHKEFSKTEISNWLGKNYSVAEN